MRENCSGSRQQLVNGTSKPSAAVGNQQCPFKLRISNFELALHSLQLVICCLAFASNFTREAEETPDKRLLITTER